MSALPTVEFKVEIVRFADASNPGWVECRLIDAFGHLWTFIEKYPIVSSEILEEDSSYPQDGSVACQVVSKERDDRGREILLVDTEYPWHVKSTTGQTRFHVLPEQLCD